MHNPSFLTQSNTFLGDNIDMRINSDFIAALASVVFNHMVSFGLDVEAFAGHCRRTVINSDDVLLCARRNESLKEILSSALQNMAKKRPTGKHVKE
ncbi:unnamed protein product [Absidia cylindrospora]